METQGVIDLLKQLGIFALVIVGMSVFIGWLISRAGWHKFTDAYQTTYEPPPEMNDFSPIWLHVFGMRFREGIARISFAEGGIYLWLRPFFRFKNLPLFIPYNDIKIVDESFFAMQSIEIGAPRIARLSLYKSIVRKIEERKAGIPNLIEGSL